MRCVLVRVRLCACVCACACACASASACACVCGCGCGCVWMRVRLRVLHAPHQPHTHYCIFLACNYLIPRVRCVVLSCMPTDHPPPIMQSPNQSGRSGFKEGVPHRPAFPRRHTHVRLDLRATGRVGRDRRDGSDGSWWRWWIW